MINIPEGLQMQIKSVNSYNTKNKNASFGIIVNEKPSTIIALLKAGVSPDQLARIERLCEQRNLFEASLETIDGPIFVTVSHPLKPGRAAVKEFSSHNPLERALKFLENPKKVAQFWLKSKVESADRPTSLSITA